MHPKRQNSIRIQGIKSIFRVAAAAIVLLLLAGGVWWQNQPNTTEIANLYRVQNPIKVKKVEGAIKLTEKTPEIEPETANLNRVQNPVKVKKVEGATPLIENIQIPLKRKTENFVKVENEVKKGQNNRSSCR